MKKLPELLPVVLEYHREASLQGIPPEPLEITEEEFDKIEIELGSLKTKDIGLSIFYPGANLGTLFGVKLIGTKKPPDWGHLVQSKVEGQSFKIDL